MSTKRKRRTYPSVVFLMLSIIVWGIIMTFGMVYAINKIDNLEFQFNLEVAAIQKQIKEADVQSYSESNSSGNSLEIVPLDAGNVSEHIVTYEDYGFSSEEELDTVERVVMQESGNQPFAGQVAVAQCIKNTATAKGVSAFEVVTQPGQYADPYPGEVNDGVKDAVKQVFVDGYTVTPEPIRYFYAPKYGISSWHETHLEYVMTIDGHRFFKERGS